MVPEGAQGRGRANSAAIRAEGDALGGLPGADRTERFGLGRNRDNQH